MIFNLQGMQAVSSMLPRYPFHRQLDQAFRSRNFRVCRLL